MVIATLKHLLCRGVKLFCVLFISVVPRVTVGRDRAVGIATHYRLDSPGSNPGEGEI